MEIYGFYNGEKKSLTQLAAESGVSYDTLLARYKAGVPFGELVDIAEESGVSEEELAGLRQELTQYVDDAVAAVPQSDEFRPNLLDNWYFGNPVNQRGKTSYTAPGYTIDRWAASSGSVTVAVEEGGIRVSAESGSWQNINQAIEFPSRLNGKTVTLSAFVETNHHIVLSLKNVTTNVKYEATIKNPSGVVSLTYDVTDNFAQDGDTVRFYVFVTTSTSEASSVMLKAVKLELGDTQTLARLDADGNWQLNEMPSYGLQLENCRRYYQRIRTYGTYALPLAFGYMSSTTAGRVALVLPTSLRAVPTMTASSVKFSVKSASTNVNLSAKPTVFLTLGNVIHLSLTSPSSLNTNSVITLCYYGADSDTHYIEFSADL